MEASIALHQVVFQFNRLLDVQSNSLLDIDNSVSVASRDYYRPFCSLWMSRPDLPQRFLSRGTLSGYSLSQLQGYLLFLLRAWTELDSNN